MLFYKLKDKLIRQINDIETLDSSVKYELLTRLNTMPKHTKLCHGDFCPDNIIVNIDDNADITSITAVDWVHGKGTYVAASNSEIQEEEQRKEVELDIEMAVKKARRYGISDEDIKSIFSLVIDEN